MKSPDHLHTGSYVAETKGHTIHSWAKYYDKILGLLSLGREKRFRSSALELVAIQPGMRILDVGCGTGSLTIAARRKMGVEGEVVGIDPSSNMIEIAQQKAEMEGVEVEFSVGVVEKLDFPDGQFDLVLSSLMMHHLPEELQESGLHEVHRVLKPNGTLLIIDLDPSAFSLGTFIHGGSAQLSAALENIRGCLESCGYVSIETGRLKFRGFSFIRSKKLDQ